MKLIKKSKTMINLSLTTKEATALELLLSLLIEQRLDLRSIPDLSQKLQRNPDLRSAWEKLKAELDDMVQAQQMLAQAHVLNTEGNES